MSLSIVIPACNEGGYIDACLSSLSASTGAQGVQVIVSANGCTDDTVTRARAHATAFTAMGWSLKVLDLPALGKMGAMDAGDDAAQHANRLYLDADVTVSPALIAQVIDALGGAGARYVSGSAHVTAQGWISRAYARFWVRLPFVAQGVPGFGLYAVNAAGRARWGRFPALISDDTFVRVSFAPNERVKVAARYNWPVVEGFAALVRVRRRQNQGVEEMQRLHPDLMRNEDKGGITKGWLLRRLLADPVAFGVYGAVALAVKAGMGRQSGWVRGR